MPAPQLTLIRGTLYPSQTAAARALGVHLATVHQAIERGTEDNIGSGGRGKPCEVNGQVWPSQSAAARAIGVRRNSIRKALAAGRSTVRPGSKGGWQ